MTTYNFLNNKYFDALRDIKRDGVSKGGKMINLILARHNVELHEVNSYFE